MTDTITHCPCGTELTTEGDLKHKQCFACRIQTVNLGSVPNHDMPSYREQARDQIEWAKKAGVEIESVKSASDIKDKREQPKPDLKEDLRRHIGEAGFEL